MSQIYNTWVDRRSICVGRDEWVNPLWHCFGANDGQVVDRWTALRMMQASRTWLLPVNCHRLEERGPIIGHGHVTYDRFRRYPIAGTAIPCLNINHQTTAKAAVDLAKRAFEMTGVDLLKLEVLTDDLRDSNDTELLEATELLVAEGLRVMPLISADTDVAAALPDVPVIRVMGSPIGSGAGIRRPDEVAKIAEAAPVILDGGIGTRDDAVEAFELGCAGVLVNSCLFRTGTDPAVVLRWFRERLVALDPPDLWEQWWDNSRAVA